MTHGSAPDDPAPTTPWYRDGLRFECTMCGDCCTGDPGVVWVSAEEIAAIANELEISADDVERRYVRRVGIGQALFERFNGDCCFFDGESRRCTVYGARPVQCRTWPFLENTTASPQAWQHTGQGCPGVGRGALVPATDIVRRVAQRVAAKQRAGAPQQAIAVQQADDER